MGRERAAGGHRPTGVGFAHHTLLAKKWTESVAVSQVTTRVIFGSRTNSNSSAFVVVPLLTSIYCVMNFEFLRTNPSYKPLVADYHSRSKHRTLPRDRERARRGRASHHQRWLCPPRAASEKTGCIGGCMPEYECFKEL